MEGCIARIGLKRQKFPVFSRETGNIEAETGSPMTASTAREHINSTSIGLKVILPPV
jgi:hypothetical protein